MIKPLEVGDIIKYTSDLSERLGCIASYPGSNHCFITVEKKALGIVDFKSTWRNWYCPREHYDRKDGFGGSLFLNHPSINLLEESDILRIDPIQLKLPSHHGIILI